MIGITHVYYQIFRILVKDLRNNVSVVYKRPLITYYTMIHAIES